MLQTNPSVSSETSTAGNGGGQRILIGIVIAIIVGLVVGGWIPNFAAKTTLLGDIFLNALKMIVVPLVMFSMIVGITGLGDIRNLGPIGGRTVLFYMATTGISVLIGLILVNIIQPGKGISRGADHPEYTYTVGSDNNRTVTLTNGAWEQTSYDDRYALILTDQGVQGAIQSMTENSATVKLWEPTQGGEEVYIEAEDGTRVPFRRVGGQLISDEPELQPEGKGVKIDLPIAGAVRGKEERNIGNILSEVLIGNEETGKEGLIPRNLFNAMVRTDILPLIFFALLIGCAFSILGERGQSAINFISVLNDGVMRIVHWIMVFAPIGIFGLVAGRIGRAGGFTKFLPELLAVGKYSFTVIFGLAIHAVVVLPLILLLIGRRNPLIYAKGMGAALLNAFSTASSSATLPLTMEGTEKNDISNRTSSFVLPLGATINMDGTALYEAVAAMFIAQVYGITLGPVEQVVIFLTATIAAIGAAGIPEAGLVTMVIVLKAVGLPIEGIGLILTIDWFLDRCRTTINVWGDSVGAGVIETLESGAAREEDSPTPSS